MSRIAYIGVLAAGAVLTVVGLSGAGPEAAASGDGRVCAAAWCPKERPGWRSPEPRGEHTTTTKPTTTTTTPCTTTSSTTTTTSTTTTPPSSTTTTTTSTSTTTTTPPTSTSTTTTTTTPPVTTTTTPVTTTPPKTTPPVTKPPQHQDNRLASTGASSIGWLVALGVLLAVAGALMLLIDRARHTLRR